MRARTEIAVAFGGLAAAMIALGAGSVGLLARMGPAIGVILEENDASLEAAEGMLALLALPVLDDAGRARFQALLRRATANVTLPGEREALAQIAAGGQDALAGEAAARLRVVAALQELAQLNRDRMIEADQAARQLGLAGAWAATLLLLASLGLGTLALRRLLRRLVLPLDELHRTLAARAAGDTLRRCRQGEAVDELAEVRGALNDILDAAAPASEGAGGGGTEPEAIRTLRAAALTLLDARPAPCLALAPSGALVAANRAALERLAAGEADLAAALAAVRAGDEPGPLARATSLGDGAGTLLELAAAAVTGAGAPDRGALASADRAGDEATGEGAG